MTNKRCPYKKSRTGKFMPTLDVNILHVPLKKLFFLPCTLPCLSQTTETHSPQSPPPPSPQFRYPPHPQSTTTPPPLCSTYSPPSQSTYPSTSKSMYPPHPQSTYPLPLHSTYPPPSQSSYPPTPKSTYPLHVFVHFEGRPLRKSSSRPQSCSQQKNPATNCSTSSDSSLIAQSSYIRWRKCLFLHSTER